MMIGYFPNPYPDELFYSICARYSDRMQYPTSHALSEALFGKKQVELSVDLPSYLDKLVAALPQGHSHTADKFIDEHTFLPYYGPFLPLERLQGLRNYLHGDGGREVLLRVGIASLAVPRPKILRFCPQCVDEDRKNVGECYWHRIHQVPGVEVCPIHENSLEESSALIQYEGLGTTFISAESAIQPALPCLHNLSKRDHEILLKIARDTQWLLGQQCLSSDIKSLHKRCLAILAENGLTSYTNRIYTLKLYQLFKDHFPPDILSLLHCELNEYRRDAWFIRLMYEINTVKHPLHYLLLMHLFGYTAESFFNLPLPEKHEPFGEGPWPCLNPICIHFREPQIREIHIIYGQRPGGRPLGIFSCACGFEYTRTGPDLTPVDRLRIGHIRSYGHIWEATLQKLWNDPTVSLRQITSRLGSTEETVNRQAKRLGLPFPRVNSMPSRLVHKSPAETTQASYSIKLAEYRASWLAVLKEHPGVGLLELRKNAGKLYKWLIKNDRDWLKTHPPEYTPASKKGKGIGPRKDWKSLDSQVTEAVKASALRLRNAPGEPIRLTVTAIGKDSGHLSLLRNSLDKLPLSAEVLANVVETREEFAIRAIRWAAELYRLECTCPTRWQFAKRAGVHKISERPQVKDAIDAALESLHPLNGGS